MQGGGGGGVGGGCISNLYNAAPPPRPVAQPPASFSFVSTRPGSFVSFPMEIKKIEERSEINGGGRGAFADAPRGGGGGGHLWWPPPPHPPPQFYLTFIIYNESKFSTLFFFLFLKEREKKVKWKLVFPENKGKLS
nr:hypothetical protein [Morchella crassipes]